MTLEMITCNLAIGSAAEKYPTEEVDLHIIPFISIPDSAAPNILHVIF